MSPPSIADRIKPSFLFQYLSSAFCFLLYFGCWTCNLTKKPKRVILDEGSMYVSTTRVIISSMKVSFLGRLYLLALSLIVLGINVALVSGQCQGDQKALLLDLKVSLGFNQSKSSKLVTWDSGGDCCGWEGVSCDPGGLGHVIGLDLSYESIYSWSPSGISGLRYLRNLSLAFNSFNSTIPDGLANLTELAYLNLSTAGFFGQVPAELSQMAKLVTLDLSVSSLYSTRRNLILQNPNLASLVRNLSELTELYLDGISLAGGGKDWWQALSFSLPNLKILSMSNCNLSGPIDASLKNLKLLSNIKLSNNNFSGRVPDIFSSFSNLTTLHLSSCGVSGAFPDTVFKVSSLETLDISGNKHLNVSFPEFHQNQSLRNLLLSDTVILGKLPQSTGYLKNLSRVELARCNLTGMIPSSMVNLTQLVSLDLSFNKLTGGVPSFHESRNLTYLDLSQNQLSGDIPSSYLEGILNLTKLDLSYNQFNGNIPSSLFEITSLQQIQLSNNQFGGQIPEFPSASTSSLNILDLSGNSLVGTIPRSVFNLSKLNILSLSSNQLNGSIQLDWVRKLENLTSLDLSHNSLTVEVTNSKLNLSSFPKFTTLKLASCNLTMFPDLGNQSKLYLLDLSNNNIPEVLPWLERYANGSLVYLNLSRNLLKILPEPTNFHNLANLDVHGNQLLGNIPLPPPFSTYVDYSSNNFNSSIPLEIVQSMNFNIFISLGNNSLTGRIPESICNASYLQVLDLSNNYLNGTIPPCLIGGNTNLGVLNLRRNCLSGAIPDNFQDNCGLQTLDLSSNGLHGKVPGSLANCTKLEVLDLGNNQINDTFPCSLKDPLSNLRVLILRNNSFHGQIGCPNIPAYWEMLQIVDLAQNQFNGVLPERALVTWKAMMEGGDGAHDRIKFEALRLSSLYYQDSVTVTVKGVQLQLVKILTYFTSIDFSCNQLEGSVPEAMGYFKALYLLNLSHNSFSGSILPNIGNLSQLESLDLSVNNFSGAIPGQITELSFLSFLNVSGNKLTGEIPKGTQIQSFSRSSFEDNPGLCGPPLTQQCQNTSKSVVTPSAAPKRSGLHWQFILPGLGFGMGAAAFVAPLMFHKDINNWCDNHVDRILLVLLPIFGFVYYTRGDWRIEPDEIPDKEHSWSDDEDDDTSEGDFTGEGAYCLFCSKLDVALKRVVHDPKCSCHPSPPISYSSSYSSSVYS